MRGLQKDLKVTADASFKDKPGREVSSGDGLKGSLRREEIRKKAQAAVEKTSLYGVDFDPAVYITENEKNQTVDEDLDQRFKEAALLSGFDPEERERSGSYFQRNDEVLYERVADLYRGQVEIMNIERALDRYDWLWDYWWRAVAVDMDKFTAYTELYQRGGYFIRILPGVKLDTPLQSCLLLSENEGSQRVHNIIIAEEGSRAEIISGCSTVPKVEAGMHLGVSELFIKKGAYLSFTMIHNWAAGFHVRPRTAALVEEDGAFINNYILLKPVRSLQSNPKAVLEGRRARTRFNSIVHGRADSIMDLGSVIELVGEETRGEAISRAASNDLSQVLMRGKLIAHNNSAQARLECKGMLLSPGSRMRAVPELEVNKAPQADLTHEAAVGPISQEAVEYLMARGLREEEATSLLIQGFMKVGIKGLPEILSQMVEEMANSITAGGS